jgi:SAM-dependent methyltransferase
VDRSRLDTSLLSESVDIARWPGGEQRDPPLRHRSYLPWASLATAIRTRVETLGARRDLRVLDVGCGDKPYFPLVAHRAVEYRGFDANPGPHVDDLGSAEALPYDDGRFDLVLSTQVLEHLPDPGRAVAEIGRVLAPGGVALVSTHGVHVYHPDPPGSDQDFWRWTHAGLARLFKDNGDWREVDVSPLGGAVACLSALACWYLDEALKRLLGRHAAGWIVAAINRTAEALDGRYPKTMRGVNPGSLSTNYLVTARR